MALLGDMRLDGAGASVTGSVIVPGGGLSLP